MFYTKVAVFFVFLILAGCSSEKKMVKHFRLGEYQRVINHYKSIIAKDPAKDNGEANYYIAESYRLSNRIREAEPYYEKAMSFEEKEDLATFYYAQSLKANGKYLEAKVQLEDVQEKITDKELKDRIIRESKNLDYLKELDEKQTHYEVKNMEALNTPGIEYAPFYIKDNLYFTTNSGGGKMYAATGTPFTKIYKVAAKGANIDINTMAPLPEKINSPHTNEGCTTFSPNGRMMVFAKGNTGKRKGAPDVDLYVSRLRRGKWTEAQRININLPDSWESTPAFSPNGQTIYFSSNREGGYGGLDLYAAHVSSRGRFSRVRNLGSEVNTSGNEMFPFVSKEGNLFFSSDGHPGYGMLDLFSVSRRDGKNRVENMGQPINSPADDFGIFFFKVNKGFFSSNREGGKGDDDLYTFVNHDPSLKIVNYYLQGTTLTSPKDGVVGVLPGTKVVLLDLDNEVMQEYFTGRDGKFVFRVYKDEDYTLIGEKTGHLVKRQPFTMRGKSVPPELLTELTTDIFLDTVLMLDKLKKNKIFVLNNIYFDFNKYNIRPDAARELNKLVQLLRDNPEIKIEMGSHTDSVDTHEYNRELSQKRAESTVAYLMSRGISPDRLTARGYGEENPIAPNTNPDGSDNPVGRQKNRRTEFKILEIGSVKKTAPKEAEAEADNFEDDKYFDD